MDRSFSRVYPRWEMGGSSKSSGSIKDAQGRGVAYFDPSKKLFCVKLSGPPLGPATGPSIFQGDGMYMINVQWSPEERARWEAHTAGSSLPTSQSAGTRTGSARAPPYTDEEKRWLKDIYRGEFNFLQVHGLRMHNENDREEGRNIVRVLMRQEGNGEDDFESDGFDEAEIQGHMADYHFSHRELNWIEANYGNSEQFMLSYGMNFYKDDDCKEAKAIVRATLGRDFD